MADAVKAGAALRFDVGVMTGVAKPSPPNELKKSPVVSATKRFTSVAGRRDGVVYAVEAGAGVDVVVVLCCGGVAACAASDSSSVPMARSMDVSTVLMVDWTLCTRLPKRAKLKPDMARE